MAYFDCHACGGQRSIHPTRHIHLGGQAACVDEGIAEFVFACWQVGLQTRESCQNFMHPDADRPAEMFLSFATAADHLLFGAFLIEGGPPGPLLDRLLGHSRDLPRWDLALSPSTSAWDGPDPANPPVADLWHSATFPPADAAEAMTRLQTGAAAYPDALSRAALLRRLLSS
jgi:hypothetical protein